MSRIKYGAIAILTLGAMTVLSGCGVQNYVANKVAENVIEKQLGGNADVDIKGDGTATYKTDQGTVSTENKIPETWPKDAPVYPGAKVLISGQNTDGDKGISLSLSDSDSSDMIFKYYTDELKNQGWDVTTTSTTPYGNVLEATKDTRTFNVVIMSSDSSSQITSVVTFK